MGQRNSANAIVRKVEYVFYNEKNIRRAVNEKRLDSGGHTGGENTGHAFVSDPTAVKAIRDAVEIEWVLLDNGDNIRWPERWIGVINAVYSWCGKDSIRLQVAKMRYRGCDYRDTCAELHISQSTYSAIMAEIRNYAMMCACQEQLIRVF